ncbi:hypothetical protein HY251_13435 [bacterium]|nr:hypothetical protein [bacterium]
MRARLATRLEAVPTLDPRERNAMFALFEQYYSSVTRERFLADLSEKQLVIRIFAGERLAGFSTIQLIPTDFDGRRLLTVFSGDTVIDRAWWGTKALQRAFFFFLMRTKLARPLTPVFWFLISKGHKTYLLMRNNFTSWPNRHGETPARVQALLDHVARLKFREHYDAASGIVRFSQCLGAVRPDFVDIPLDEAMDPEVRFFLERNPAHAAGDELCCLAEIRMSELLRAGAKYLVAKPLARLLGKTKPSRPEPVSTGSAAS